MILYATEAWQHNDLLKVKKDLLNFKQVSYQNVAFLMVRIKASLHLHVHVLHHKSEGILFLLNFVFLFSKKLKHFRPNYFS